MFVRYSFCLGHILCLLHICNMRLFIVFLELDIYIYVPCAVLMLLPVLPMLGRPWPASMFVDNIVDQTASSSVSSLFSVHILFHSEYSIEFLCYSLIYC